MARIPYVPFDDVLDQIFQALGITVSTYAPNGAVIGWVQEDFEDAWGAAWDLMLDLAEFDYNGDGEDDLEETWEILIGGYTLKYWSTDSGHMPE